MPLSKDKEWEFRRETKEVRELIARTPDLRQLYSKFGYDADVDKKSEEILGELRSLLRPNVSSISVFHEAVDQTRNEIEQYRRGQNTYDPLLFADQDLWKTLDSARDNPKTIDTALQSISRVYDEEWDGFKPLKDRLPHPCDQCLFITWRVNNIDRFTELLDALEIEFGDSKGRAIIRFWEPDKENCKLVWDRINNLRTNLEGEHTEVWRNLLALKETVQSVFNSNSDKKELDDLLWQLVYVRIHHDPRKDNSEFFRETLQEQAKKYLEKPWMHTPWLTNRLITDLLKAVVGPVSQELRTQPDPTRFTSQLPWPWGILAPKLLSFVFFVICSSVAFFLFVMELQWFGWGLIAYLVWHYFWRFRRNYLMSKARGEAAQWALKLEWIRNEVATGHYDAAEIAKRLRDPSDRSAFIPSLVFPLLRLVAANDRIGE